MTFGRSVAGFPFRRWLQPLSLLLPLIVLTFGCGRIAQQSHPENNDSAEAPQKMPPMPHEKPKIPPIPLVSGAPIEGLDVSHFQNEIDWPAVADSGRFAFVYFKATEGIDALDERFAENWQGAREVGLLRGAYHFYEPPDDPIEQANFFLTTIGPLGPGDLPPALDVEITRDVDTEIILEGIQKWLDVVENATGRRPLIYTGYKFWNALNSDAFGDYPLWLAEYDVDPPLLPLGWDAWTFWQYNDQSTVEGISKEIDLNHFAGSLQDLQSLADL